MTQKTLFNEPLSLPKRRDPRVTFDCPNCGRLVTAELALPSDLRGPRSDRVTCQCGADLLVLGPKGDLDVIVCNRKEMLQAKVLRLKPVALPAAGLYYDLVHVPHGHVPVSKVWPWRRFPLVVKEFRGDRYFKCPECGSYSFFKADVCCRDCAFRGRNNVIVGENILRRWQNRARHNYFRRIIKDLEVLFLPVFALWGRAWYVRSERIHPFNDDVDVLLQYFWRRFQ